MAMPNAVVGVALELDVGRGGFVAVTGQAGRFDMDAAIVVHVDPRCLVMVVARARPA